MIPFVIKTGLFKKKIRFSIPSEWKEISLNQYQQIQNLEEDASPEELFRILTGQKLKVDFNSIAPFLNWISEPITIQDFERIDSGVDIWKESYKKKILFSLELGKQNGDIFQKAGKLLSIYLPQSEKYFLNLPIGKSIPLLLDLIEKLKQVQEKESLISHKPTEEEQRAGIKALNQLSHFNTIDQISRDYGYKHSEVENLEFEVVYFILLRRSFLNKFEKKLNEIRRNDNRAKH